MNIYHFSTGHEYLKGLFSTLSKGRSTYSYNAFARDLQIGSASLHRFLNGERSLSDKSLNKISDSLKFSDQEKDYMKKIFQVIPISEELRSNQKNIVLNKIELSSSEETIVHEVIQFQAQL